MKYYYNKIVSLVLLTVMLSGSVRPEESPSEETSVAQNALIGTGVLATAGLGYALYKNYPELIHILTGGQKAFDITRSENDTSLTFKNVVPYALAGLMCGYAFATIRKRLKTTIKDPNEDDVSLLAHINHDKYEQVYENLIVIPTPTNKYIQTTEKLLKALRSFAGYLDDNQSIVGRRNSLEKMPDSILSMITNFEAHLKNIRTED